MLPAFSSSGWHYRKNRKEIKDMKFTILIFGFLLVVPARNSISHASEDVVAMGEGNEFLFGCDEIPVHQKHLDHVMTSAMSTTKETRSKMLDVEVLEKEMAKGGDKDCTSVLTGKDECISKRPSAASQIDMDNEKKRKLSNLVNKSPTDMATRASHVRANNLGFTSMSSPKTEGQLASLSHTIGSKRLHNAAMETLNMLNSDYKHKPRRKPPVNNGKPPSINDVKS